MEHNNCVAQCNGRVLICIVVGGGGGRCFKGTEIITSDWDKNYAPLISVQKTFPNTLFQSLFGNYLLPFFKLAAKLSGFLKSFNMRAKHHILP